MQTSRLTIDLPESELNFLKQYASRHKTTISQLVDRWVRSLQSKPDIHPDIKKFTGIIPGNVDVERAVSDYVMEKHK